LYARKGQPMSIAIVSLILLVVVAIIVVPVLIRVFGEAARRNPNRPEGEGSDEVGERDRTSGPGRE
jgi:hypothetical protein